MLKNKHLYRNFKRNLKFKATWQLKMFDVSMVDGSTPEVALDQKIETAPFSCLLLTRSSFRKDGKRHEVCMLLLACHMLHNTCKLANKTICYQALSKKCKKDEVLLNKNFKNKQINKKQINKEAVHMLHEKKHAN